MSEETGPDTRYAKPSQEEIKRRLTDLQYQVTQQDATERPFSNEYNNEKRDGIYVDIVSGEPLFSSREKFDSGTGWPSFSKALKNGIRRKPDHSHGMRRTEIVCARCNSHLGHVFNDGPEPSGERHCVNSISLEFKSKPRR